MTPTVGGTINANFYSRYDTTVQAALSSGSNPYVILDLVRPGRVGDILSSNVTNLFQHNYARWNGAIISQGGPTDAQFASLWSQLADKYKNNPKIIVRFPDGSPPHEI